MILILLLQLIDISIIVLRAIALHFPTIFFITVFIILLLCEILCGCASRDNTFSKRL